MERGKREDSGGKSIKFAYCQFGYSEPSATMSLVCQHLFENYLPVRQAYLFELLNALRKTGISNGVWTFKSSNQSLFSGHDLHSFQEENLFTKTKVRLSSKLKGKKSYLSEYLLNSHRLDFSGVVHAHFLWMSVPAQEIKRRKRVPIFLTAYGEDELFRAGQNPNLSRTILHNFADFDAIFAPSAYLLNLITRLTGTDSRLKLWHIGIDVSKYAPVIHKARKVHRVLCVSRLIDRKGLRYLVEAIPDVLKGDPNVSFVIIGEGPERGILLEMAKRLGVAGSLEILPYQSSLVKAYSQADVFVLPSVIMPDGVTEGLGVPLLEAEASGLPIVASNVGGIPDAVETGKQGFLVAPADAKALADRILRLICDADLRQKMGFAGQNKVRDEFNIDVQAKILSRYYAQAC